MSLRERTNGPSESRYSEARLGANLQQEVIAEAERMIPDAQQRLEAHLIDLKALLVGGFKGIMANFQEAMDNDVSEEKRSEAETVIQEGKAAIRG